MSILPQTPPRQSGRPATTGGTNAVRAYLRDHHGPITARAVADAIGLPAKTVRGVLVNLARRGEAAVTSPRGSRPTCYRFLRGPAERDRSVPVAWTAPAGRDEIARRTAIVRAAKWAKWRDGHTTDLQPEELDAVLPIGETRC